MGEYIQNVAEAIVASAQAQLLGTFLAPGSSLSLPALAVSLVVLILRAVPRGRSVRPAVLRRALFPRRLLGSASGRCDLVYFIGGVLFAGLAISWAIVSAERVGNGVQALLGTPRGWSVPAWVSAPTATVALFVAYEFGYWLDHWLKHRVPFLWRFHAVHHQAESLSLLTNGRVHPVDTIIFHNILAVTMGVTGGLITHLFGNSATPLTLSGTNILILITAVVLTHLQHSHLWWTLGPRCGRWLLGPAHHQIHHSADPDHFNRNLGGSLAVFDRLFGTFHMVNERPRNLRFGVDGSEPAPHGLRAALIQPFVDGTRDLHGLATRVRAFATKRAGRVAMEGTPSAA